MTDSGLETDIFDGNWHASTLGEFIGTLVDLGDAAVTFRVTEDSEPDDDGLFTRAIEVVLYPDGLIKDAILGCRSVHKLLKRLMEEEVLT